MAGETGTALTGGHLWKQINIARDENDGRSTAYGNGVEEVGNKLRVLYR